MEAIYVFFHWTDNPVGQIHLFAAYIAILAGPVVFLRRKGDLPHRVLGYIYFGAMLTLNVAALTRYTLTGSFNFFHFAALMSLLTILPGVWMAIRYKQTRSRVHLNAHGTFMSWSYFGLMMAFVSEMATRKFPFLLSGEYTWPKFFLFLAVVMSLTGWWTARQVRRHVPRRN